MLGSVKLTKSIAYRRIGEHCVIILTDQGRMLFLNETAATILEMLDTRVPDDALVEELVRTYAIERTTAQKDYEDIRDAFAALQITVPIDDHPTVPATDEIEEQGNAFDPRATLKSYCAENGIPLQCFIEVTEACNLKCSHCYIPEKVPHNQLSTVEYKHLFSELRDLGCLEIILTGGEPLLNPNLLELCEYARRLRFSVIVKTNATLLSEGVIDDFRRLHITEVQVSLYSLSPAIHDAIVGPTGSHAKTMEGIRRCREAGQRCRISCVVMRSNYRHLEGLKEFAAHVGAPLGFDLLVTRRLDGTVFPLLERVGVEELGWLDREGLMRDVIFNGAASIIRVGDDTNAIQEYAIEDPESRICGAANTMAAITSVGEVRPCIAFPYNMGNVRDKPLREILSSSNPKAALIRDFRNSSFQDCNGCLYLPSCPRCMATIYQETGQPVGKAEAICQIAVYHQRYGG
jgi:radical SAM protein with 4Fe4S-binding SPASM domain